MAGEARPAEALPALFLVEVVMSVAIEDEGGLHQVAHRFGPQFKTQAHAAVGVQHVGQVAELVDRAEKLRVETQALAMARVGHPTLAFLAQHPAQLLLQKLFDAPESARIICPASAASASLAVAANGKRPAKAPRHSSTIARCHWLLRPEAEGCRPLPGLFQWLREGSGRCRPTPRRGWRRPAAIGLGVGEVDVCPWNTLWARAWVMSCGLDALLTCTASGAPG